MLFHSEANRHTNYNENIHTLFSFSVIHISITFDYETIYQRVYTHSIYVYIYVVI